MTNEIQIFNSPEFGDIRAQIADEEPWLVGKDIAVALEYQNAYKAIVMHVDKEDRRTVTVPYSQNGRTVGKLIFINESGLYSLILSSKLPSAKKFKRWITSEVLPALRKTGKYEIEKQDLIEHRQLTIDDYIRAASIIAGCRNERMPTVIALLKKGGIEVPPLADLNSEYDEIGETASLINRAVTEYGLTVTKIGKLCGLHPTQITRIRTGQTRPKKDRAKIIQKAIREEVDNLE